MGYRFDDPGTDSEQLTGIMWIACANEHIAAIMIGHFDNMPFQANNRLRIQAELAGRALCRDRTMGTGGPGTPGYTRTSWGDIWTLRTDCVRRGR